MAGPFRGVPGGTHAPATGANAKTPPTPTTYDYERTDAYFPLTAAPLPETSVYVTKQRWRACDVYISVPHFPVVIAAARYLTIAVYAISEGVKSLIATGRMNEREPIKGGSAGAQKWIVGARAVCDAFEVTITSSLVTNTVGPPGNQLAKIHVAVIASDEATLVPPNIGASGLWEGGGGPANWDDLITTVAEASIDSTSVNGVVHPPFELVAVNAYSNAGAPAFLLLSESQLPAAGSGLPRYGFGLPAIANFVTERNISKELYQSQRWLAIWARTTTTGAAPFTATAADAVPFQVWWR